MEKCKLIVATHKESVLPTTSLYLPVLVGAEQNSLDLYTKDNTGEHISALNPYYSELTGLYWAWKNLDADYIGLVHYRRYFKSKAAKGKFQVGADLDAFVLQQDELTKRLTPRTVIVPTKRRYYIESLYSHYANTLNKAHLDVMREIIAEQLPDYLHAYDVVMQQTSGYMFNMFIMSREQLGDYCEWLFPILFELQERLDMANYSAFEARLFGRVSELLFNVWLHEQDLTIVEQPLLNLGDTNWFKKISAFLAAKFLKKKYTESF
ncbi:DUF4422 domain-containing protein [Aerococcaceae bacterium NML160702]|nr:DUF4422 domain-containing protein [Aerococcaceae bacterium NML160702]